MYIEFFVSARSPTRKVKYIRDTTGCLSLCISIFRASVIHSNTESHALENHNPESELGKRSKQQITGALTLGGQLEVKWPPVKTEGFPM